MCVDSVTPSASTSLRTLYALFLILFHGRNVVIVRSWLEANFTLILVYGDVLVGLQMYNRYPKMPTKISSSLHLRLCEIPSP